MDVYIIGAGPGDPELLTIKGRKALEQSDLVIYAGSLVNPKILHFAENADETYDSSGMDLEQIIDKIDKAVKEGKTVARVHTGDPAIYGAIQEQIKLFKKNSISYQIIPGVSSFLAAAAAVEREFTLPDVSQTVILTRREGRTAVPEKEKLKKLASHQASMAIFLSVQMIERVTTDLKDEYPEQTPIAVVEKASWPEERVIRGRLNNITEKVKEAGIKSTAMILVGDFLTDDFSNSKLYDKTFSHGFRKGTNGREE